MNRKYQYAELATTQAVGAKTVVMDRPPEMTMVPGRKSQLRTVVPGTYGNRPSATPSVMTTTVLKPRKPPPPPPPPSPRQAPTSLPVATAAVPMRAAAQPPPIPQAEARPQPATPSARKPVPLRTRMVDLRDALASQGPLPPLPRTFALPPQHHAPGPAAPALLSMPRSSSRWRRVLQERRSLLVVAAAALLLLLLLPQLVGEGEAEALVEQGAVDAPATVDATEMQAATQTAASVPQSAAAPAVEPEQAAAATPESAPITEAQAGALLLSGRRAQALASYRALAQAPGAHAGIEAMVIVLEQKVNPR